MPFIQQELGANAPDVTGSPYDKDSHWREECSVISGKSKAIRQVSAAYRAVCASPIANLKLKCVGEYFARQFCSSSFREPRPSSSHNDVCNAGRGLSNFLPPNPIVKCRCRHSGRPSSLRPTEWPYKDR